MTVYEVFVRIDTHDASLEQHIGTYEFEQQAAVVASLQRDPWGRPGYVRSAERDVVFDQDANSYCIVSGTVRAVVPDDVCAKARAQALSKLTNVDLYALGIEHLRTLVDLEAKKEVEVEKP
jgi:hypothetical protein